MRDEGDILKADGLGTWCRTQLPQYATAGRYVEDNLIGPRRLALAKLTQFLFEPCLRKQESSSESIRALFDAFIAVVSTADPDDPIPVEKCMCILMRQRKPLTGADMSSVYEHRHADGRMMEEKARHSVREVDGRGPDPLIPEQLRQIGDGSTAQFETSPLLLGHPLALCHGFAGRFRNWFTISWRTLSFIATQQALKTDTFAADLHTAVYLDPNLGSVVNAWSNSMQRHDDVLVHIRSVCKKPSNRAAVQVCKSCKFHRGHCTVASFDLRDSRTGQAERFSGFTLAD